jgi:hypothetical protein
MRGLLWRQETKERKAGSTGNGKVKTSGSPNVTCSGCGRAAYGESKCWICHPALKKAASNWKASTKQKTQANIATAKNTWCEDELFIAKEQRNETISENECLARAVGIETCSGGPDACTYPVAMPTLNTPALPADPCFGPSVWIGVFVMPSFGTRVMPD